MPQDLADRSGAILNAATRVLDIEAEALRTLRENLPGDFVAAVRMCLNCKGRVILSGIGKSGHIARKIAATLASTGTPASFVHPSEASHGDLGMITRADVCILISNSGETQELSDLITYTRRFDIPMVGISRDEGSTLMREADLRLTLPAAPEACSIGMAPTTSTTLTLALGDALAVALMDQRAFKAENFRQYHPGGKLGMQLALVRQLMHGPETLAVVAPDTPMTEALVKMSEQGFGLACVVRGDTLVGVISDGDLRRNITRLTEGTAGEIATRDPKIATPDMLAAEALRDMNAAKVNALVVVDGDGRPVGLIRIHDCLRAGLA